ncbi:MAG: TonB-dependent receptor [Betaproteobacteria bacterium]
MKTSVKKRCHSPSANQFDFRLSPVAAACAMALFAMTASAQQADPATEAAKQEAAKKEAAKKSGAQSLDTVVVTGIRRGIEEAISVKQSSNSIVEAISAEDIGKLPDNSIAESIARLPGLAAQRVAGRATTVSIRGMSGDFASTLLNGREQVSTGDNRAVEFNQYPSELLSGVLIYKTPDGALIGQGLSGTVDLQTVRPLSFSKRTVAVSLRGEKNSLGALNDGVSANGSRLSASYINQSTSKTFGIALGYAHLDSPSQVQRWEAWGYATADTASPGIPAGTQALGGNKIYAESIEAKRDGVMAVLEWKPNKDYSSLLDLYYSKFNQDTTARGMEFGLVWGADSLASPVVKNGFLVSGNYIGVKPVLRNDLNKRTDDIKALGWNNKLTLAGGWTAVGDLSWSKAKRDESILETYAGTTGAKSNFQYSQDLGTGLPTYATGLNYADPSIIKLVDSGGWGQDGFIKFPKVTDELKSFRLTAKRDLQGFFSQLDVGVNYSERNKTRLSDEFFVNLKSSPTTVPSGMLTSTTSLGYVGIPGVLSYNIQSAYDNLYQLRRLLHQDVFNKDWTVEEKVSTLYGKMDIDTEFGSIPVRGNVGFQVINTDQNSTAFAVGNGNATTGVSSYSDGKKYTDFLPSLNLAFSFADEQTFRIGIAKTMVRARLDQLRASNNYSLSATDRKWSGSGGNPRLDPFRANSYDVSYEKYFGTKAYVSVAAFYKELKSYIFQDRVDKDFTGYPNPSNGAIIPISNIGGFDSPVNGQGGRMNGVEIAASLPFNLITQALDGFGAVVSHADTDSSIKPNGPNGGTQPLPGLSRRVTNVSAYYEKYGFSARVSQRERSAFVGEVTGFGADREFRYIKGERVIDAQVGYAFDSGSWKGLSLLLQVNNVNNTPYQTYDTVPEKPNQYTTYGRTTLLGVNYKF